ncbi:hypothetical protein N7478_009316 [Penicillium angulare]|uniref:uncharacterized protein n=1 Tax=Penicillium angulare TaxID=116970 RepID=UPI0025417EED|nr:uncharacterized protein N7478_009316 [Penicillium angulare]KAJ5266508.1 hypothetical protein N7478_009316 [Penicillium angulare]
MLDELDMKPFGLLPFDHYVMDKWDSESPLAKTQQFRALVNSWVRLGKEGRNKYPNGHELLPDEIPSHVPQDLMSDEERATDGQTSRILWIRTWFGRKDDPASQSAADAGYRRIRSITAEDDLDDTLDKECFFDSEEFRSDSSSPDGGEIPVLIDGIACGTPGSMPSYIITALMKKPDMLDGLSDRNWPTEPFLKLPEPDIFQYLMIVVADRKACEEEWMLFLAVNHKGRVLPFRVRERASWTTQLLSNFMNGQNLDENTDNPEEDIEYYMHEGDGWAPSSAP